MTKNPYIRTLSGRKFYPVSPQEDQICIEDIAAGLARQCRYSGQLRDCYYSVAEHSLYVSELLPDEYKLAGLLHDATEAYLSDIAKPIKSVLPDYQAIEENVFGIIEKKFNIYPYDGGIVYRAVKEADYQMLIAEFGFFFPDHLEEDFPGITANFQVFPYGNRPMCWSPSVAESMFLAEFYRLTAMQLRYASRETVDKATSEVLEQHRLAFDLLSKQ